MNYAEIRTKIKSGDILAFSHVGWNSWHDIKIQMVRMFTRSEYSHIATAWVCCDRVFVIEAVVPEIRIFPLSKLGDFYWIPMDAPWTESTEELALSLVGQKYSQLEAMESFFDKTMKNDLWYCSEFSRALAEADGISIPNDYHPSGTVKGLQEIGKEVHFVKNS